MADIIIYHKRTEVFHTCSEVKICRIALHNSSYTIEAQRGKDRLHFRRVGDEKDAGFVVDFDQEIDGVKKFTANDDTLPSIFLKYAQNEGDYKYTISYPNDTEAKVVPLDPLIIIKKPTYQSTLFLAVVGAVSFVAGAAISQLLDWSWF